MMKKPLIAFSIFSLLLFSCSKEKDPFLITSDAIGHLNKEIKVKQLDSIFAQDSLVKLGVESNMFSEVEQIEIFDKEGAKLLLLTPEENKNPESKIIHIQIFDERFKTENGIHINSTFKEVKENYSISSIVNTMKSVIISLENSDVYLTIDKEDLPDSFEEFGAKIVASDIPDQARFKFLMIDWEDKE